MSSDFSAALFRLGDRYLLCCAAIEDVVDELVINHEEKSYYIPEA